MQSYFIKVTRPYIALVFLLSFITNALMLTAPVYMTQIYGRVLSSQSVPTLVSLTIIMTIAYLGWSLFEQFRMWILRKLYLRLDLETTPAFLGSELRQEKNQIRLETATRDMDTLRNIVSGNIATAFMDIPFSAMYLLLFWLINPLLFYFATVTLALILLLSIIGQRLNRGNILSSGKAAQEQYQDASILARSVDIVRAFGIQKLMIKQFAHTKLEHSEKQSRSTQTTARISAMVRYIRLVSQSGIIGLAAWMIISGQLHPTMLFVSMVILGRILAPFDILMSSWPQINEASQAWGRIADIKYQEQEKVEQVRIENIKGQITLNSVHLNVGDREANKAILENITLRFPPASLTAIAGRSGAGKTSLLKVILGLNSPTSGQAFLDDVPITAIAENQRQELFGYAPQFPTLLPGNLAQNTALNDHYSLDKLAEAAKKAGILERISSLPQEWQSPVQELRSFSGGELNRLNLARALYANPKIIVLDEPTASLDPEAAKQVIILLLNIAKQGTTVIVASHDEILIRNATHIVMMQEGKVRAQGPREEIFKTLAEARKTRSAPPNPIQSTDKISGYTLNLNQGGKAS